MAEYIRKWIACSASRNMYYCYAMEEDSSDLRILARSKVFWEQHQVPLRGNLACNLTLYDKIRSKDCRYSAVPVEMEMTVIRESVNIAFLFFQKSTNFTCTIIERTLIICLEIRNLNLASMVIDFSKGSFERNESVLSQHIMVIRGNGYADLNPNQAWLLWVSWYSKECRCVPKTLTCSYIFCKIYTSYNETIFRNRNFKEDKDEY